MSDATDNEAAFATAVERAARELAGETEAPVSDHPGVDEVVDFQEGRLDDDDAQRLRRHLEACPECAREVRELERFDAGEPGAELRPSPEQTAADWARFQEQIARVPGGGGAGGTVPQGGSAYPPSRRLGRDPATATAEPADGAVRRRPRDWLPMAASVLLGLIGVGFWVASQQHAPPGPQPAPRNPFVFDLVPDGEDRVRDAAALAEVEVPAGMDTLVPRLNLGDQTPYGGYRAEIVNDAGATVWSQGALRRQPAGEFVVLVDRDDLPAGTYRLSVIGLEADRETVLATYTFELSDAAMP